jgi:hypothetical protein
LAIASRIAWKSPVLLPGEARSEEQKMEALGMYPSVLVALSVALLLVVAGVGKNQLVWKRPKPLRVRARRRL